LKWESPMPELQKAVLSIFHDCFHMKNDEQLLILCDDAKIELGMHFFKIAKSIGLTAHLSVLPPSRLAHESALKTLSPYLNNLDAAIFLTTDSISHTSFRRQASRKGTRIASMPGITREILIRNMNGNYKKTVSLSRKLADILTIANHGHILTPAGTNLHFSLKRMKGYADTGLLDKPGTFSNLPFGEAAAAPAEHSAEGTLVLDSTFSSLGTLAHHVKIKVKAGYATRISGNGQVDQIRKMLRPYGQAGRLIAEVGIGTNGDSAITGSILEDEKKLGTLHIAMGNNTSFGGKNNIPSHHDGLLLNPTLILDGKTILDQGRLAL